MPGPSPKLFGFFLAVGGTLQPLTANVPAARRVVYDVFLSTRHGTNNRVNG